MPTRRAIKKPIIKNKGLTKTLVEIPLPPTHKLSLPPDTTAEDDVTTAGQRKINLIWEYTQCFIACFSTIMVMVLGAILAMKGRIEDFPPFIALGWGLVIGFYFQRTNHSNIGGTGKKPLLPKFQGR